jgi:hypothetical protein
MPTERFSINGVHDNKRWRKCDVCKPTVNLRRLFVFDKFGKIIENLNECFFT